MDMNETIAVPQEPKYKLTWFLISFGITMAISIAVVWPGTMILFATNNIGKTGFWPSILVLHYLIALLVTMFTGKKSGATPNQRLKWAFINAFLVLLATAGGCGSLVLFGLTQMKC